MPRPRLAPTLRSLCERVDFLPSTIASADGMAAVLLFSLIASVASADLSHTGSTSPVSEGWIEQGDTSITGVSAFSCTTQQGPNAWCTSDGSTDPGSAIFYSADQFPTAGTPWTMRARLEVSFNWVIDPIDLGMFFEVTDSANKRFVVELGSIGPDDLFPGFSWVHLLPSANATPTLFDSWPIGPRENLLLVELASDGTTADLFVNGVLYDADFPGFSQPSVPPRVLFGSGSSAAEGWAAWVDVAYVTGVQACSNGVDDDGNGLVDALDPYCESPLDPREGPPPVPCTDGVDTDSDGICDVAEPEVGTSATDPDTDDDGLTDGAELLASTDPLDPLSPPPPPVPIGAAWPLALALGAVAIGSLRRSMMAGSQPLP